MRPLIVFLVASCLAAAASADVPHLVAQQGVLRNAGGIPVTGTYSFTVSLHADADIEEALWQQSYPSVGVVDGRFALVLGAGEPLPPSVLAGAEVWVQLQIEDEPPLSRSRLVSVPFALRASHATSADTLAGPAADLDCSGCVGAAELGGDVAFVEVADSAGQVQFAVSNDDRALRLAATGNASVTFDAADHVVTISASGVTQVVAGQGLDGGTITGSGTIALAQGGVEAVHLSDQLLLVDVRDGSSESQIAVTKGANDLSIAGGGATTVSFDSVAHRVTISSTDAGGDVTGVAAGAGLTGGGESGDVTLALAAPTAAALGGVTAAACSGSDKVIGIGTDGQLDCAADQDAGGDVTGVTAGAGLSGGGTSGDVTLGLQTPSASTIGGVKAGSCSGTQKVTGIGTDGGITCAADQENTGDITGVTAGTGLGGGGDSGGVTLNLQTPSASTIGGVKAGSCSGTQKVTGIGTDGAITCAADQENTGDITGVTAGTGLGGGGSSGGVTLNLQTPTASAIGGVKAGACSGTEKVTGIGTDGAIACAADQNAGGDITGVTAGTGLGGGGSSGSVTLNLQNPTTSAIGGVKAGSCSGTQKVTGIGTDGAIDCAADQNAGGDITGVTAGTGLTGGGSSGDLTLNVSLAATDIPTGATGYVQNQTAANQSASFRISGTGQVGGNLTVSGGTLTLAHGTANAISFGTNGVAAPTATSAGWKLRTYGTTYGIGISSSTQWYSSSTNHRWYSTDGTTWTQRMNLDSSGKLSLTGVLRPLHGNSSSAGIQWDSNIGGGAGDEAFIRYYAVSGESTRLRIGAKNDANDGIWLDSGLIELGGAQKQVACPTSYSLENGVCYRWPNKNETWNAAQETCASDGAHICTAREIVLNWGTGSCHKIAVNGDWLGDYIGDDRVLDINDRCDKSNFEGDVNPGNSHEYVCCIDPR